jgi:RNA polymerase sigma factor for flagellar operon FliA
MSYDKDSLILSHLKLAEDIAKREWRTATHALKHDDMLSLAYEGLVDAAIRWEPYCLKNEYDPNAVQYFKAFASFRIRGTIRDQIRKEDWATRTLRGKSKRLKEAGQDDGLTVPQLSEATGMTVPEINKVIARLSMRPVSLDAKQGLRDYVGPNNTEIQLKVDIDTEGIAFANAMNSKFISSFAQLPQDVRVVLVLHYYMKMDLRSIAEELGLSESKISQLHYAGIIEIKDALTDAASEEMIYD